MPAPQPPRAPLSEATLRWLWRDYLGVSSEYGGLVEIQGHVRMVADPAALFWLLFGTICTTHGYKIEKLSMWLKRFIGTSDRYSQHSYGATGDVNYYLNGKNGFNKGWSWDKTDFTPELVNDLLTLRTNNGKQVFAWGGTWRSKQDYMHWYPGCGPKDMATGIDMSTLPEYEKGKEDEMKYFLEIFNKWTVEDLQVMKDAGYWKGNPAWYYSDDPALNDAAKVNLVVNILANGNKDIPAHAAETILL